MIGRREQVIIIAGILLFSQIGCSVGTRDVTPKPEATAIPETSTPTVTATEESHVPDWLLPEKSINISDDLIDRSTIPGTLVLSIEDTPYLYEVKTDLLKSIQIENAQMVTKIDLAKSKLAYVYCDTVNTRNVYFLIRDLANNEIQKIQIDYDKQDYIYYWANPEALVLVNLASLKNPLYIYNTQSRQYITIPMDYPEIGQLDLFSWRMWGALGVVNSDLNKLVYLGVNKLIVQDLTTNKKLFEIDSVGSIPTSEPIWSPDGKSIALIKNWSRDQYEIMIDNLYIATMDGDFRNLTNLDIATGFNIIQIPVYQWAPSGSKIAFWINTMPERQQEYQGHKLAIADLLNGQITLYNISSHSNFPTTPVWSEDEKLLAISVNNADDSFYSYIHSLRDNKTYPLPEDAIPYGWVMIS